MNTASFYYPNALYVYYISSSSFICILLSYSSSPFFSFSCSSIIFACS